MNKLKKTVVLFMIILLALLVLPGISGINKVEAATKKAHLNYTRLVMTEGYSMKLKLKGGIKKAKWNSSNKKIATVNKKGKVTGKKNGKCVIFAKTKNRRLKCRVVIKQIKKNERMKPCTDAVLNVAELSLDVSDVVYNESGQAELTGRNGEYDLRLFNAPGKVIWKTSNDKIALVKGGKVTSVSEGTCIISAVFDNVNYNCVVNITDFNNAEKIAKQEKMYEMLNLINTDRIKAKVLPLKIKEEVCRAADIRAVETAELFEHLRPDGTLYTTAYSDAGLKKGHRAGENLAYIKNQTKYMNSNVADVYKSLYESPGHKANMLNPQYEYIGISFYTIENFENEYGALCSETYCTQEFYTE